MAKAKEELSFIPTPWEEVLLNTVNFYEGARNAFMKERDIMLKRLNKNVVPYLRVEPLNDEVTKTVTTTYGAPKAPETKVEL